MMIPKDWLTASLRAPKANGPALVAYLVGGYPDRERFRSLLRDVAQVADAIEIGVPFTDPMADGLSIQEASRTALQGGASLRWILDTLAEERVDTPLLLMSYLNPLLSFGLSELCERAAQVGVTGLIVPDLPLEEAEVLRAPADAQGLAVVQLVTPVTPQERLRTLCEASGGFVYAVTVRGTTGGASHFSDDVLAYLDRVRAVSSLPVCAGFGIRDADQVDALAPHVDGVIVGSALLDVVASGQDPTRYLAGLRR